MRNWMIVMMLLALGCTSGNGDDGDDKRTDDIPDGPGDKGCGETDPVIDNFTVEYGGMRDYDEGTFPSLALKVDVSDEDGDLTYYEYRVWWDSEIDGAVETSGYYAETYGTVDGDDCEVNSVSLTMYLGLAGGSKSPPYSTELEFGAIVRDDKTNESGGGAATVQVFTTPDASGNF